MRTYLLTMAGSILTLAGTSSPAQIAPSSTPLALYSACLNDAIAQNNTSKRGKSIQFNCYGANAKTFFDRMGKYGIATREQDFPREGVYRIRAVSDSEGSDYCWQKIATADGSSTSSYGCEIYLPVGDFLNL